LVLQENLKRKTIQDLQEQHSTQLSMLVSLNEKSQALVAASDPLAFQQIQAMNLSTGYDGYQDYDPSDEGEAQRILDRNPNLASEGEVNAEEQRALLAELTGVDPEFFGN
jgi:hypothetical protein